MAVRLDQPGPPVVLLFFLGFGGPEIRGPVVYGANMTAPAPKHPRRLGNLVMQFMHDTLIDR